MNMRSMLLLGLVATLALFGLTDAATYTVGTDGVWDFQNCNDEYNDWASTINFTVSDVLVFNFLNRTHDVATVTKAKYENCDGDSPLALASEGPASITLNTLGINYFISTLQAGDQCNNGMKLAVNVNAATNETTPSPSPSPTWIASPPPSPLDASSAHTVVVGGASSFLVGMIGILVMGIVMV